MKYISVIVDKQTNATDRLYTYISQDDSIERGSKVRLTFGRGSREIDGYVADVSDEAPDGIDVSKIKSIIGIDEGFSLSGEAMNTAMWMHSRYACRYMEAVKCFLPSFNSRSGRCKDPFADIDDSRDEAKLLNDEQGPALERIVSSVDGCNSDIFLLHGVTGSGKTEIYLQAMSAAIEKGKGGIVLVPEISLTPQTVSRFTQRFGKDAVAVLHSKLTPAQKDAEYKRISSGNAKLVIGARSAVFAPLRDIGLIIFDEEHESSYKSDQSPKYDAIEVAAKRAMQHSCPIVLGSATPSVTDFYRSEQGVFKRISLRSRYNSTPLPKAEIVDMTKEVRSGNRSPISRRLAQEMADCLGEKKQIILFLNRRGYSSHVVCRECGYTVKCEECGIAMPFHKDYGACLCHYCGRKKKMPEKCPECGSPIIGMYGVGTQQLEEKVSELFPDARTGRVDLDSVTKKGSLESILKSFADRKTDILIGTQLVAKGLDFANVGLVGIISADVSLNIPDYRSSERTFQLITQSAGRSGRGDLRGSVIIQTYQKDNFAVRTAAQHDYESFYRREMEIRRAVAYPPFSVLFQIITADESKDKAFSGAGTIAEKLRQTLPKGCSVLGPAPTTLVKMGGKFRYQILIKAPADNRRIVTERLIGLKEEMIDNKNAPSVITTDINPYSFM